VIQTGLYLSVLGPNYVYVRFRCGRCKRIGEQLIHEHDWDPAILREAGAQAGRADLKRFAEMGDISAEEVIEFHYALARLSVDPEGQAE